MADETDYETREAGALWKVACAWLCARPQSRFRQEPLVRFRAWVDTAHGDRNTHRSEEGRLAAPPQGERSRRKMKFCGLDNTPLCARTCMLSVGLAPIHR